MKKKKKIESKVIVQAGIVDNLPKIQQRLWKHTFQKTGRHKTEFTFQSCAVKIAYTKIGRDVLYLC